MYAIVYFIIFILGLLCLKASLNTWFKIFIISTMFAVLASSMVPRPELFTDTKRFFSTMESFRVLQSQNGFFAAWENLINSFSYADVPIAGALVALGALFTSNAVFMFIVGFIISFCAMSFIFAFSKENDYASVAYFLFFSWFNYQAAVQGVRNMMAYLLLSIWAYYVLTASNKASIKFVVICLSGFFAVFIHSSAIVVLGLVALNFVVKSKFLLRLADLFFLSYSYFQAQILPHILKIGFFSKSTSLVFKTNQYMTDSGDNELFSSVMLIRDLSKVILMLIFIAMLLLILKNDCHKKNILQNELISNGNSFFEFCLSVVCLTLGSVSNGIFFDRLSSLTVIVLLPYISLLMSKLSKNPPVTKRLLLTVTQILFIVIIICSLIFLGDNLRAGTRFYSVFSV